MAKGLPRPGAITCILCPKGCRVEVDKEGTVTGNCCPKGKAYALAGTKVPRRVLTTTLRRPDGTLLPMKTLGAVPKEALLDCAARLSALPAPAGPVTPGTVLYPDPFGLGIPVAATQALP